MKKVVFFGTPEIAVPFLSELVSSESFEVCGVVTKPDQPLGRKKVMTASAVAQLADENGIKTIKPSTFKDDSIDTWLSALEPDLFVIFAYGKIIPQRILDLAPLGSINVHPSKLPELRGPSPIQSAIALQLEETAISIMLIDSEMDHGPLLLQHILPLDDSETTESLSKTIMSIGPDLLVKALSAYVNGEIEPKEQDHEEATFCKMIKKEDGEIDLSSMTAKEIEAKYRAFSAWPSVRIQMNGEWHKLAGITIADFDSETVEPSVGEFAWSKESSLLLGTKEGTILVNQIQPPGKAMMDAKSFKNGLGGKELLIG